LVFAEGGVSVAQVQQDGFGGDVPEPGEHGAEGEVVAMLNVGRESMSLGLGLIGLDQGKRQVVDACRGQDQSVTSGRGDVDRDDRGRQAGDRHVANPGGSAEGIPAG
jgi:hypothetical protein